MANHTLSATPTLSGYSFAVGETHLAALTDLAIVAIAWPEGYAAQLETAAKSAWGISLPKPRQSSLSKTDDMRLIATQPDQVFAVFKQTKPLAENTVQSAIGNKYYVTDQTDGWVALSLSGPLAEAALERISPVDLNISEFPQNASARTLMEHLGVLIVRTDAQAFLLLSASSSAKSFSHALETSLNNVS